jgi:hypothetical protein
MGADLSRVRLNPLLDYAGVELKQGGVLLDADANELMAIVDRRLRALASDTLGPATVSSTTPDGFKITVAGGSLQIGKGRLYVGGLLAENHGAVDPAKRMFDSLLAEPQYTDPIRYAAQPYLPSPPGLPTAGRHLVYLDVWDREVTYLEQPELVEDAVGVETSSRVQTVWQVRTLADDAGSATTCASPDADLPGWSALIAPSTGVLSSGTFDVAPTDDPCELPPTGGYRGLENQLYRVEIQDPGQPGAATFKWSRDNASIGSRVASVISTTELELETLGRDDVLRFNTGDWVEITDDARELSQAAGEMRKITVIEATKHIQFTGALPAAMIAANFAARHLRVRRWDQKGSVSRTGPNGTTVQAQDLDAAGSTGVIAIPAAATTFLLEAGVTVSFASTGAKGFRAGDYWVFAARTADASVEVLDRAPPRGIHHRYARLGLWDVAANSVTDCRHPWPPNVEGHDCSCTACVTAESHGSGQFTIQDAVNKVRETGGTVCLGVGQFPLREPVRITNGRSVRIRGQGPNSLVISPGGAFVVETCIAVAIENLAVLSLGQNSAITVSTAIGLSLCQLVIDVLSTSDGRGAAISLQGLVAGANISENIIIASSAILANDPVAVPPAVDATLPKYLVTAVLAIEDNVFWCAQAAVTLTGTVMHLLSTHIVGNEMVGCAGTAISALGLGESGSSMTISCNSINVTGNGIRCAADGIWIESNKLSNTTTGEVAGANKSVAIAVGAGLRRGGADQCHILANQIDGFGSTAILVTSPTRELIVKLNIIENCGNGIITTDEADGGSVSIENNHLRAIGSGTATLIVGIGVTRAESVTIAGNIIRALGLQTGQTSLRTGIFTLGVLRVRVSGNEVTELAPAGDFVNTAAGIMLRAPYAEFEVNHNLVQRDATPSTQTSNGAWSALVVGGVDSENGTWRAGDLSAIRVDSTRTLVLRGTRAYLSVLTDTPAGAAANEPPLPRGSVLGNVFNARGTTPVVNVSAAGECLFNDNRVEARLNTGGMAVILATNVAIVNANRVRGGETSIQVTGATIKTAAVLGNITTGRIAVAGVALPNPWHDLNLIG